MTAPAGEPKYGERAAVHNPEDLFDAEASPKLADLVQPWPPFAVLAFLVIVPLLIPLNVAVWRWVLQ